jgi:cobalamin biosynthesis protein CobD/CbiB
MDAADCSPVLCYLRHAPDPGAMGVIAIIAALLLEQWRPLGDRKAYFTALAAWADWLDRTFNAGEPRHGLIAWLVAVLPPVAAAIALYAFAWWLHPLAALLVNVAALYLTLGFRQFSHHFTAIQAALRAGELDRAREELGAWRGESALHRSREELIRLALEEAIVASHRHVFGVLFWFAVLPGPAGAILYRMGAFLQRRWRGLGQFGAFAERVQFVLEWPAARLTATSFAVVGDFEDAVYCWRSQAAAWPDANLGIVLAAGAGAMGVKLGMPLAEVDGLQPRPELGVGEPADAPFLDSAVGLLWRALVVWVFLLGLISLARVF